MIPRRKAVVFVLGAVASVLLAAGPPSNKPFPMVGMLDWKLGPEERAKRIENRTFTLWLMTSDTTLAPGDTITLLWNAEDADTTYRHDEPVLQRGLVSGRSRVKAGEPGNMYAEKGDVFYHVAALPPGPKPEDSGIGFALRARPDEFRRVGNRLEADLDRDGVAERFFTCASYEGVHLTVWSGEPLKGKERWHRYYYVPYDTEPSCVPSDTTGVAGED